jgi:hypothetical protein
VLPDTLKVKSKYKNILPKLGLKLEGNHLSCDQYTGLFPAWKWLAARDQATELAFSRCMFDPRHAYLCDNYARLFGDENAFDQLVLYLDQNGYQRIEHQRGAYVLDFVKKIGQKDAPLGNPLHGDPNHYGIAAEYKPEIAIPQYLVLRILDMKNILLQFDLMPKTLPEFILKYAKECDHCGYCTQTDKTGKRKSLEIDVFQDGSRFICPLYPGFRFCFTQLDDGLVTDLMAFLGFMDKNLQGELSTQR